MRTLGLLAVGALSFGCSTPDTAARVDPIGPDRASFAPVATMLVRKCGTLDCHGSLYQPMRLYGAAGLRLDPGTYPYVLTRLNGEPVGGDGLTPTEPEIEADYAAVIGVEPEIMRDVVLAKGAAPERLTLVRKARGAQDHKGNVVNAQGTPGDVCLVSWLASQTDVPACAAAIADDPRP